MAAENIVVDKNILKQQYDSNYEIRHQIVVDIRNRLEETLVSFHCQPAIKGRIKDFPSFYKKYIRLLKNGVPDPRITDLIGIRIICPFIEDLVEVERLVSKDFKVLETERKGRYTFNEFGYESIHLLVETPEDIAARHGGKGNDVVEIQIRTILQDAWAEVEHELVYKVEFTPFDEPIKRKLAAVNASLSLADIIFQEIRIYQRKLNGELDKRRGSFFSKIEESTDALLFDDSGGLKAGAEEGDAPDGIADYGDSIDDLLLSALSAHNKSSFGRAIALYTKILSLKPNDAISSLIFKHRGMAHFASSQYEDAISDFSRTLELDKGSYKAAYYQGLVYSVLKKYNEAISDFSLSLAINPYQPFCLFRRGQAYYHIGDFPKALSDCEASLSLEPDNDDAVRFKAMLYKKLEL